MASGSINIGTSGWNYKHWRGIFYPQGLKLARELPYYASQFNATEINNSFYRLPGAGTVADWISKVPKNFYFCPKISRYITHAKKLNDPMEGLTRFFSVFDPFRKSLGPILIQLPSMLGFHRDRAETFFRALKTFKGHRFALEPRHTSWMEEDAVRMLKKYRIAFVLALSGGRWPSGEFVTAPHIYIRLHGPNGYYDTSYSPQKLAALARKCRDWQSAGHTIWVFFNNDGHAYAVKNAMSLAHLLISSHKEKDYVAG